MATGPDRTLTRTHAVNLAARLARSEVTSEELVTAHLAHIDEVDPRVRAFTEVFRRRALEDARASDQRRRSGEALGPLEGLPVTVKECFDMAGLATTLGVASRRTHQALHDATLVTALRGAGAVILGRTNLSQLMLFAESRNPLFGQTNNPFALDHAAGGSSGGEAAALAAGMSPLGIGTDIGGSLRNPAHFCGVASLKPTLDRWSARGCATALLGQEAVRATAGPLARSARDVAFLFSALDPVAMSAADPRVPPLAAPSLEQILRRAEDRSGEPLRVGFFVHDGLLRPSPAVSRAVDRAAQALRSRGWDVVPFRPPRMAEAVGAYFAALSADGGATVARATAGERLDPVLESLRRVTTLPGPLKRSAAALARALGDDLTGRILATVGEQSVADHWATTAWLRTYRFEMVDAFDAAGVDAILCPPHATPATPHGGSRDFALAGSPSMLWNVVQFPAGVVPVTRVRAGETTRTAGRGRMERLAAAVDARSEGLPVGVQVVARPWREDLVLAVMVALEDALASDPDVPRTPVPIPA